MKKILGSLILSIFLLGGCTTGENPVQVKEPYGLEIDQTEETPEESDETEAPETDNPTEEGLKQKEEPSAAEEMHQANEKAEEEKKGDGKTETDADAEETGTTKGPVKPAPKPSTQPAPAPETNPGPAPVPQPAPEPQPVPEPQPEPAAPEEAEESLVTLPDGTGKDHKVYIDGFCGALLFDITREEHEHIGEGKIIRMITPPGTYKEGTLIRLLVSSGKPVVVEEPSYDISFQGEVEAEIIRLVNAYRAANGLSALEVKADLSKSARYKSRAMIEHDYFSHDNPQDGNVSFGGLMRNVFGYTHYGSFGENLAARYGSRSASAENLFQQWKSSDGHNKNMLDPGWKYIGVGVAYTSKAGPCFKNYPATLATQHFAR